MEEEEEKRNPLLSVRYVYVKPVTCVMNRCFLVYVLPFLLLSCFHFQGNVVCARMHLCIHEAFIGRGAHNLQCICIQITVSGVCTDRS